MRIVVDTNRYCDFCRGDELVKRWFQTAVSIALPFVVVAELRAGFVAGTLALQNERILQVFLGRPRVRVLWPDEATTHQFARLYRQLRQQGTPIPVHDVWIGALALQHDLLLCSRDAHFDHLPQLPRLA